MGSKLTDLTRIVTVDTGDLFYIARTVGDTGVSAAVSRKDLDGQLAVSLSRATDTGKYLADTGLIISAASVAAAGAVMESDTSTASMSFVIDDDTMATASATTLPTSESVKAYTDTKIGGSTGADDNRLLRSDGTGTKTLQNSGISVDDSDQVTGMGGLVIGGASKFVTEHSNVSVTPNSQVLATGADASFLMARFSNNSSSPRIYFAKSRGTTVGSHGAVSANDEMGAFSWAASNGTAMCNGAQMFVEALATAGTNYVQGQFRFQTSPGSDVGLQSRLSIGTGIYHPSATGGDKGDNTINFGQLWYNGVQLSPPGSPVTKTGDFTVADSEQYLINNKSGSTCTVTLPTASSFPGRVLKFKNLQAQTVVSASSNVAPRNSATPGTAIPASGAGNWCEMVSDGSNWIIMAGS